MSNREVRGFHLVVMVFVMIMSAGCFKTLDPDAAGGYPQTYSQGGKSASVQTEEEESSPGVWHSIVWYLPNRVLDFLDIFRARVRVGPGLAANARITDLADAYIGEYHTWYLGLPGPRMGQELGWFAGEEQEKGIKFLGVDASDDLDNEPDYSPTEINLGLHLLIVGTELGFDPVELGDFLAGFFLIDAREDDW